MQPPPLELVSHTHYYCGGNVMIAPTAAIGPGVVLQALAGGSIFIGDCACLGAGVVIQARTGSVTIEAQASLGASVLVVGQGLIGRGACIGSGTTLINPAIAPHTIIPPNSLIGAPGEPATANVTTPVANPANVGAAPPVTVSPQPQTPHSFVAPSSATSSAPSSENPVSTNGQKVYGRDQVNGLLSALFPSRQSLNEPIPPETPPQSTLQ